MPKDSSRSARTRLRESRSAPYRTSTGASTWNTNWGFTSTLGPKQPVRRALFSDTPTSNGPMSRKRSHLTGHYKGRLPAPKRPARPGKFALNGHRAETERWIANRGSPDVCYVGAQVAPAGSIGQSVGVAFLRMIMKRHYNLEYSTTEQQLRPLLSGTGVADNAADAGAYSFPNAIKFWRKTTNQSLAPTYDVAVTYAFPVAGASSTVASFGIWFAANVFSSPLFGCIDFGEVDSRVELHAYQFVEIDFRGAVEVARFRNGPVMPLEGQYLSSYSVTRVHIQNVTPADGLPEPAGAVYQSTRIDANPLKGVLMRFKGPTPMVKDAALGAGIDGSGANNFGWTLQQDINGDGLILPGAPAPIGPWSQIPSADMFKNCAGVAHISLEPGDIKDYSLSFRFNGTLQALMKGFNTSSVGVLAATSVPTPSINNKQFGQSFMFALEKRMPTGPAPVNLNIHYENYYGSVFGRRRRTPMVRQARSLGVTTTDDQA